MASLSATPNVVPGSQPNKQPIIEPSPFFSREDDQLDDSAAIEIASKMKCIVTLFTITVVNIAKLRNRDRG